MLRLGPIHYGVSILRVPVCHHEVKSIRLKTPDWFSHGGGCSLSQQKAPLGRNFGPLWLWEKKKKKEKKAATTGTSTNMGCRHHQDCAIALVPNLCKSNGCVLLLQTALLSVFLGYSIQIYWIYSFRKYKVEASLHLLMFFSQLCKQCFLKHFRVSLVPICKI